MQHNCTLNCVFNAVILGVFLIYSVVSVMIPHTVLWLININIKNEKILLHSRSFQLCPNLETSVQVCYISNDTEAISC